MWRFLTIGLLAIVATAMIPAMSHAQECVQSVKELVKDAGEQYPDVKVEVYTGAEAKRIVEIAAAQSGRGDEIKTVDTVTVLLSEEAGGGMILLSEGDCSKLGGRGTIEFIQSITKAAQVGGST